MDMDMKTFFKGLFEYNHNTNLKLARSFVAYPHAFSSESFKVFCHILNGHEIWNSRIQKKKNKYGVWDTHDINAIERIIHLNQEATISIIEEVSFNEFVPFSKAKGQKKVSDVLFHVINHSTYHRGQIVMDFRKNGIEPLVTDYILYEKESYELGN